MSRPFVPLTIDEFAELLARYEGRRIDAVHMHHTWRPNHAQWKGIDSVEAMWRFHTQTNHWSDIAQHVTIGPDGVIWTGRDWRQPPASAVGFNGNRTAGPFMFETAGDFDLGKDALAGAQREAVVQVIAQVQERFGLPLESLRFHRDMTDQKTCPGTGVDFHAVLAEVRAARDKLAGGGARAGAGWVPPGPVAAAGKIAAVLRAWNGGAGRDRHLAGDPADAETADDAMTADDIAAITGIASTGRSRAAATRADELTPAQLQALRPHVIDLNQGRFSGEGRFTTSAADVDAIFQDHLERAFVATQTGPEKRPLRVLLWAHGGLIDEASGLRIAQLQVDWWKANRIYPIHFVWETGLWDALRQIMSGTRATMPRDLADVSDIAVARVVRALGGEKIWSAMKRSAELASAPGGGARHAAQRLKEFCERHPGHVELHAVGHSAGSIFHAHFLPAAFDVGVPPVTTLQLLAPAIRVDTFKQMLGPYLGPAVRDLTMYTMAKDYELADNVMGIYRKSLLYLIFHALEPEREAPILGLEESVRGDADLVRLFGLDGGAARPARVVWSVTDVTAGRSASTSTTHGGFDNDRATMQSVAGRVLDLDPLQADFPDEAVERGRAFLDLATLVTPPAPSTNGVHDGVWTPPTSTPVAPTPPGNGGGGGRLRALCVGIDAYAGAPLSGCVADAREWAQTLGTLGFTCELLLDGQATRAAIIDGMQRLVAGAGPSDVVVFQYSGHGTHLDDLDGDEDDGQDEALCPHDIDVGAFLLDDDVADILAAIKAGVSFTAFLDCCHSGTNTRAFGSRPVGAPTQSARPRFIPPTPEMQERHRRFRAQLDARRSVPLRDQASMRHVAFAACQDKEVAWESGGHGEFTLRATALLRAGIQGVSNEAFAGQVVQAFGAGRRQTPKLDCAPAARARLLLAPVGAAAPVAGRGLATANGTGDLAQLIATALHAGAAAITARV